jgi:hypothetical protein
LQLARIAGRNRKRHPRLTVLEIPVDFVEAGDQRHDAEIGRGFEPGHELPAGDRPIGVGHHHRDVAHVGRRRVAEHEQLEDRRHDDDAEEAPVSFELDELFPHQHADALHRSLPALSAIGRPSR